MTSIKQSTANRANAAKSTGPKTPDGKDRSRLNSWKHGLTAKDIIVRGEKAADFDAFRADLWQQFQPDIGFESVLMDRLVVQAWRLRRPAVYEAGCLKDPLACLGEEWAIDSNDLHKLSLISRYETALMNNFDRTLQQLLTLQDRRRAQEEENNTVDVLPEPDEREAA